MRISRLSRVDHPKMEIYQQLEEVCVQTFIEQENTLQLYFKPNGESSTVAN